MKMYEYDKTIKILKLEEVDEVEKLKRERLAFFTLTNLKSGEYRKLTKEEVVKVYNLGK